MNFSPVLELDKVLDLLSREASTEDGALAAKALEPSPNLHTVEFRLRETQDAMALAAKYGFPSFGRVRNMNAALSRAETGGVLSPKEMLGIGELLRIIRSLSAFRGQSEEPTALDGRFSGLSPNRYLEEKIAKTVTPDEEIADTASGELADIRQGMRRASAKVRERLEHLVRSPAAQKALQEPIVTIRSGRFVVPVKAEHRSEIPGLVHDSSASGATVFIEPMGAVEANNELKVLEAKEQAEIERLLMALSGEIGSFARTLTNEYRLVTELDLCFAKASLAFSMKGTAPKVGSDGVTVLKRARHPLLNPEKAVPIDVSLGDACDTLVITGPNTGGKTVTLKTIGLLTLMVACGLIPPCDESRFSVFDRVLADIGDEQSIEQSLSTFSSHMTRIAQIVREADEKSLILLDELGSGTDPDEGAALSVAILEALRKTDAKIAATTHYAELKAYAMTTDGVENGSCEFDVATLSPTYRLLIGIPGKSNAFAISRRLGLPPDIIARAEELVSADNRRVEEMTARLLQSRQSLEESLSSAQQSEDAAREALQQANEQLRQVEEQREEILGRAQKEAAKITAGARAQAQRLLNELESARAAEKGGKEARNEAQKRLRRALEEQLSAPSEEPAPAPQSASRPIRPGDDVIILSLQKRAEVISLSLNGREAQVLAGIVRTRVPVSDLRLADTRETPKNNQRPGTPRAAGGVASRAEREAQTEIDVRGYSAEEAVMQVDRFLDSAALAGLGQVRIIHGKGTGTLRTAIGRHLRHHPLVKSFRLGTYGEGETGVTVVEMKE